nr:G protein-coupled receptor [Proales similis]
MENSQRYLPQLDECNLDEEDSVVDISIQVIKVIACCLHVATLVAVMAFAEMQTRHNLFMLNLSIMGCLFLLNGLATFDANIICSLNSYRFCEFQALFFNYSGYLYSYGVLALAIYRLVCLSSNNLKESLKAWKLALGACLVWLIPLVLVIIKIFWIESEIYYSEILATCRVSLDLVQFTFFVSIGFIVPMVAIGSIYAFIFHLVRQSSRKVSKSVCSAVPPTRANRISNQISNGLECQFPYSTDRAHQNAGFEPAASAVCQNSWKRRRRVQIRLLVQFLIIFVTYMLFSFSNIVITFNGSVDETYWDKETLKLMRLFIWLYHLINPILLLGFHPVLYDKLHGLYASLYSKFFNQYHQNRMKLKNRKESGNHELGVNQISNFVSKTINP